MNAQMRDAVAATGCAAEEERDKRESEAYRMISIGEAAGQVREGAGNGHWPWTGQAGPTSRADANKRQAGTRETQFHGASHPERSVVVPKASKHLPWVPGEGGDDLEHKHQVCHDDRWVARVWCEVPGWRLAHAKGGNEVSRRKGGRGKRSNRKEREYGGNEVVLLQPSGLVTSRRSMRGGAKGNGTSSGARRKKDVPSKLGWDGLDRWMTRRTAVRLASASTAGDVVR